MKTIVWDVAKNNKLKLERNISFEDVIYHIENKKLLNIVNHPNQEKYEGQKMFVININDYVYLVPFIESKGEIILKTIIPSRKATKYYLGGKSNEE